MPVQRAVAEGGRKIATAQMIVNLNVEHKKAPGGKAEGCSLFF